MGETIMPRKKVERTPEEWRQYYNDKTKRYYDKNKEKINERKRELYNERVGNQKKDKKEDIPTKDHSYPKEKTNC